MLYISFTELSVYVICWLSFNSIVQQLHFQLITPRMKLLINNVYSGLNRAAFATKLGFHSRLASNYTRLFRTFCGKLVEMI